MSQRTTLLLFLTLGACQDAPLGIDTVEPDLGLPVVLDQPVSGVCISKQLDRWNADHRQLEVQAILDVGIRTVREDVRWSYVERARGEWDWTTEDTVIGALGDAGLNVIAMLGYGNPWATSQEGADEFTPPDDPADFALFAGEAVKRYGDRVHRWEIWNEPNAGYRFWKVGDPPAIKGDPAGYGELFLAASQAIREQDPSAEVQFGGTFYHPQLIPGSVEFLEQAILAWPEILDHAQAVAWHPYTNYPPRVSPENGVDIEVAVWDMVDSIRAITGDLPLPVTEMGWPSWNDIDQDTQARWILREALLLQAKGVRDVCVYTLEDRELYEVNPEHAFGLYEMGPGALKPSGLAWLELASQLENMSEARGHAEQALAFPPGVWATRYTRGDDAALTAIWTVEGGPAVDLTIPPLCADGSDSVTIQASPDPVFVHQETSVCP